MNIKRLLLFFVGLCVLFTVPTKANATTDINDTVVVCDSVRVNGLLITNDTIIVDSSQVDTMVVYDTTTYRVVHSFNVNLLERYVCFPYSFNGQNIHRDTIVLFDSVHLAGNCYRYEYLPLRVVRDTTFRLNLCDESFVWHDVNYDLTGTYYYPSIADERLECREKLELYIGHNDTIIERVSACYKYTWNDSTYTESTNNPVICDTMEDGCLIFTKLNLIVDTVYHRDCGQVHACDCLMWKDSLYVQSGTCMYLLRADTNIDSIKTCDTLETFLLDLDTIHHFYLDTIVCDSYTWGDTTFYSTGNYMITDYDSVLCVDTFQFVLWVIKGYSEEIKVTACESYVWRDSLYFSSTNDMILTPNANGCLDTVKLDITIHKDFLATLWDDVVVINNQHPLAPFSEIIWYHNDIQIPEARNKEFYQEEGGLSGEYYAVVRTEDGTTVTACVKDFGEKPIEQNISVSPNPTTRFVVVKNGKWDEGDAIIVSDLNGKVVLQGATTQKGMAEMDLAILKSGIYVARIGEDVVRIVKQD